jgi:hypothetical protein
MALAGVDAAGFETTALAPGEFRSLAAIEAGAAVPPQLANSIPTAISATGLQLT